MPSSETHRQDSRASARPFGFQASKSVLPALLISLSAALMSSGSALAQVGLEQTAAGTNRPLQLAADSPFRDPDTIYLEADELINDEASNMLTAIGEVEGRYQDRTLRANRVDYDLTTGQVLASGDVVLIDATGDVQYADKLELSDELQAGTAANFTARLATGATTSARFVNRSQEGEVELYNATYTACQLCRDSEGDVKNPTWRLKARRVKQDSETRTIRYNDAVLELFGIPVFYTPFLAHPDPSRNRASGLLTPTIGISGARGFQTRLPYYFAIDDYTEATVTPHIYSDVNPLLELQARRKFHTGEMNFAGSFTHATLFDRNGDPLDDPARFQDPSDAEKGAELSSHFFLDGYFKPSDVWSYGYTAMLQSDDTYLRRYGLSEQFKSNGLLPAEPLLNTNQAFIAGQGDNFRISVMAAGFQSVRSVYIENEPTGLINLFEDDNSVLPIIAPKITGEYFIDDPVVNGRLRLNGDLTYLTRESGNDYGRASAGADYSKTWVAPGGIEIKPFVWGRYDRYDLETATDAEVSFDRTIGQVGLDVRYPFLRPGKTVDLIVEPRIQVTESFGDAKLNQFIDPNDNSLLYEDGFSADLDTISLFQPNKADGFDFFQEGRRLDVGASFKAQWDMWERPSEFAVFAGQSFADDVQGNFFVGSGLINDTSDYVANIALNLGGKLISETRLRYDPDRDLLSRLETTLIARTKWVDVSGRYFKLNTPQPTISTVPGIPPEEVSGRIKFKPFDNISVSYNLVRDLDANVTRSQGGDLSWTDDCTTLSLFFVKNDFTGDVIQNDTSFGLRLTLATLGGFGSQ